MAFFSSFFISFFLSFFLSFSSFWVDDDSVASIQFQRPVVDLSMLIDHSTSNCFQELNSIPFQRQADCISPAEIILGFCGGVSPFPLGGAGIVPAIRVGFRWDSRKPPAHYAPPIIKPAVFGHKCCLCLGFPPSSNTNTAASNLC